MDIALTSHAKVRLQQRGIPPFVVELLERFGSSMRCLGAERIFFDKSALRRLTSHLGGARGLRTVDEWLGVYLVVADSGEIVTVAHRRGRFRRAS